MRASVAVTVLISLMASGALPSLFQDAEAAPKDPELPYIRKDLGHTSLYIQSSITYQRGVREYITAESIDSGVLTYAWFINTVDKYLDGTDNTKDATWGDNGKGDGNSDYVGSYGSQPTSSNILMAVTPNTVGTFYVYAEVTNANSEGGTTTIRSKRTTLDVRAERTANKPQGRVDASTNVNYVIPDKLSNGGLNLGIAGNSATDAYTSRNEVQYWDSTCWYLAHSGWNGTSSHGGYAMDTLSPNGNTMEMTSSLFDPNFQNFGSNFQDISTVPGKIYKFGFNHYTQDAGTDQDLLGMFFTRSIFDDKDYDASVPNRFWDGTDGVKDTSSTTFADQDPKDNGSKNFSMIYITQNRMGNTVNLGKFPYGVSGHTTGSDTGPLNDYKANGTGEKRSVNAGQYTPDYFFDIARNHFLGLTYTESHEPYQQIEWDRTNQTAYGRTALQTKISALSMKNKFVATNYNNSRVQMFISNNGQKQTGQANNNSKSGYMTVPEGQGASVLAWSALSATSPSRDNMFNALSFEQITRPSISFSQTYQGENTITAAVQEGYAYALLDTTYGYARYLDNVADYTEDADIDSDLGEDDNWFIAKSGKTSIKFTGLVEGQTYRVIAIPKDAIQKDTGANMTPLDVIDPDAWVDTTIPANKTAATITGGFYTLDDDETGEKLGKVQVNNPNTNLVYALLAADENGLPITDEDKVLSPWVSPGEDGSLVFSGLDIAQAGQTKFFVVTKSPTNFSYTYQRAAYSPTETYTQADADGGKIPQGLSVGDFKLTATYVTVYTTGGIDPLSVREITRTYKTGSGSYSGKDTITITWNDAYRGTTGGAFPQDVGVYVYDPTTGPVETAGSYYKTKNGDKTITLYADSAKDLLVTIAFKDEFLNPINALAASEELAIDFTNEVITQKSDNSYDRLANIDYQLAVGGAALPSYGSGTPTKTVQGSNTQPIKLTRALDSVLFSEDGIFTYTKHIVDPSNTIGTPRTLTVPDRPPAPTIGTTAAHNVFINFLVNPDEAERVQNQTSSKMLLSRMSNFRVEHELAASTQTATLQDYEWTGNRATEMFARLAATTSNFKSKISSYIIPARHQEPYLSSDLKVQQTDPNITFTRPGTSDPTHCSPATTVGCDLSVIATNESNQKLSDFPDASNTTACTGENENRINAGCAVTYAHHTQGNTYAIAFAATQNMPRSKFLDYTGLLHIYTVDFGDIEYGKLGPKQATAFTIAQGAFGAVSEHVTEDGDLDDGDVNGVATKTVMMHNVSDTAALWTNGLMAGDPSSLDFEDKNVFGIFNSVNGQVGLYNYGNAMLRKDFPTIMGVNLLQQSGINPSAGAITLPHLLKPSAQETLTNPNTDLSVALGNTTNGNWSPIFSALPDDININTLPAGSYASSITTEYSDTVQSASINGAALLRAYNATAFPDEADAAAAATAAAEATAKAQADAQTAYDDAQAEETSAANAYNAAKEYAENNPDDEDAQQAETSAAQAYADAVAATDAAQNDLKDAKDANDAAQADKTAAVDANNAAIADANAAKTAYETLLSNLQGASPDWTKTMLSDVKQAKANILLNIVKLPWLIADMSEQASQTASGTTPKGKTPYTVGEDVIEFSLICDNEIPVDLIEVSTNNGYSWHTTGTNSMTITRDTSYDEGGLYRWTVTLSDLLPESEYDVVLRVQTDDETHEVSEIMERTFWTRKNRPTNEHALVNYFNEIVEYNAQSYNVRFCESVQGSSCTMLGGVASSGTSITSALDASGFALTASTKPEADEYFPESFETTFSYARDAFAGATYALETVFGNNDGQIESSALQIQYKLEDATEYSNPIMSVKSVPSAIWLVRNSPTSTKFASYSKTLVITPITYKVSVETQPEHEDLDASIQLKIDDNSYQRKNEASLWFDKIGLQEYSQLLSYPIFKRDDMFNATAQKYFPYAIAFDQGITGGYADNIDFVNARAKLLAFKSNTDDAGSFLLVTKWRGVSGNALPYTGMSGAYILLIAMLVVGLSALAWYLSRIAYRQMTASGRFLKHKKH